MKELRIRQEVEKEWGECESAYSADEVGPSIGLRFKFGKIKSLLSGSSEKRFRKMICLEWRKQTLE